MTNDAVHCSCSLVSTGASGFKPKCPVHNSPPSDDIVAFMTILGIAADASHADMQLDSRFTDYVQLSAYIRYEHLEEALRTFNEQWMTTHPQPDPGTAADPKIVGEWVEE